MKTVLTFVAGLLLTMTTMAADRPPSVSVRAPRHFEVVIDGRTYRNDNIRLERMRPGMHNIRVYERSRGLFGNKMRLVSAKNFYVRNNDVRITVGYNGYVDVDERGNNRRYDRNDRGWENDRDWDRNDRPSDRPYERRGY